MDLHNLLHFLRLRLAPDAQKETRVFAEAIAYQFVQPLFPFVWNSFEIYELEAIKFSRRECSMLKEIISQNEMSPFNWNSPTEEELKDAAEDEYAMSGSEAHQFIEKLKKLDYYISEDEEE